MVICPLPFLPKQKRTLIGLPRVSESPVRQFQQPSRKSIDLSSLSGSFMGSPFFGVSLGGSGLGSSFFGAGCSFLGSGLGSGFGSSLGMAVRSPSRVAQILGRFGGRFHFGFLDGGRRGRLAGFGTLPGRLAQDFEFGAQSRQIRFGWAGVRWLHGRLRGRGFNGGSPRASCGQGEGRNPREEEVQAPEQQQCKEQAEQEHEEFFPPRLAFHHNRRRDRGGDGAFRHFTFADDAIRIAGRAAGERRLLRGGERRGSHCIDAFLRRGGRKGHAPADQHWLRRACPGSPEGREAIQAFLRGETGSQMQHGAAQAFIGIAVRLKAGGQFLRYPKGGFATAF